MIFELYGIEKYDLIYIYHHLHVGSELELEFHGGCAWIYFKSFKIGFIDSSKMTGECVESVKVISIEKHKFLSPSGIKIEIS